MAVGTGPSGAVSFTDASVGREFRCAGRFVSPAPEPPDGAENGPRAGATPAVALNLTRARTGTLQLGDQHHGFLLDGLLELCPAHTLKSKKNLLDTDDLPEFIRLWPKRWPKRAR